MPVDQAANLFYWLCVMHAIADYPLQGDWLAKAKNPFLQAVRGERVWPGAMASHCIIHSAGVYWVTQSAWLALLEFVAHFIIDCSKCRGLIFYNEDQLLHIACKAFWIGILWYQFWDVPWPAK